MKSSYKRIGDLIHLVDERNKGFNVSLLLGLTISKKFIPSVANIIGSDMENYKIIHKKQFACSLMQVRRDKKIPIALLQDFDEAIISQAYPVFEVNDEKELLPEYLMMWFSREEFDREACFYAVGGVRGSLEWEDFCNMKLPVPDITKQQEIVDEYNVIKNRISINNSLIEKLEETAQAIYREWFVDFEFPDENGKPYKSSGGEMEFCSELEMEVPKGWRYEKLSKYTDCVLGGTPSRDILAYWNGDINWINSGEVNNIRITKATEKITKLGLSKSATKLLPKKTVVLAITGATLGQVSILEVESSANQSVIGVLENKDFPYEFIFPTINYFLNELLRNQTGGAQPHINKNDVESMKILYPNNKEIILNYKYNIKSIYDLIEKKCFENDYLIEMKDLILSKMASEG